MDFMECLALLPFQIYRSLCWRLTVSWGSQRETADGMNAVLVRVLSRRNTHIFFSRLFMASFSVVCLFLLQQKKRENSAVFFL